MPRNASARNVRIDPWFANLPSSVVEAFVQVTQNPDDMSLRLRLADSLEAIGQTDRARFIRLQVLEQDLRFDISNQDDEWSELERHLFYSNQEQWLPCTEFGPSIYCFYGGLIEGCRIPDIKPSRPDFPYPLRFAVVDRHLDLSSFLKNFPDTVIGLKLYACPYDDVRKFIRSQAMSQLRSLSFSYVFLDSEIFAEVASSPYLSQLRQLSLTLKTWRRADFPYSELIWNFNQLEVLGLRSGVRNSELAARLLRSVQSRNLKSLLIASGSLNQKVGKVIAFSPAFRSLQSLTFLLCSLSREAVELMFRDGLPYGGLRALSFRSSRLDNVSARVLAESPLLSGLRRLCLNHCDLSSDAVYRLVNSPYLGNLKELCLRGNKIGVLGLRELSRSPLLGNLECLDLRRNRFAPDDLEVLLRSPNLNPSTLLLLDD